MSIFNSFITDHVKWYKFQHPIQCDLDKEKEIKSFLSGIYEKTGQFCFQNTVCDLQRSFGF